MPKTHYNTMKINKETVERMAHLARLPIEADEALCGDIRRIMGYMDTVARTDRADSSPVLHSVLREDEAGECLPEGTLDLDAFTVPRTVE